MFGETVMMPRLVVNADREEPKWRYIGQRDFEILSNDDKTAESLAKVLPSALQVADVLVPPRVRLGPGKSVTFVLERQRPGARYLLETPWPGSRRGFDSPHIMLCEQDSYVAYHATVNSSAVRYNIEEGNSRIGFNHFLLWTIRRSGLKPAQWLSSSVWGAVGSEVLMVTTDELRLDMGTIRHPDGSVRIRSLIPLGRAVQVLNRPFGQTDGAVEEFAEATNTGRSLVLWAWLAENGKYRDRFWDFYVRSASSADAGEALFRECMQLSYAEATEQMEAFYRKMPGGKLNLSVKKLVPVLGGLPVEPVRDATPAEVARITGELLRMATTPDAHNLQFQLESDRALLAAAGKIFERGLKQMESPADPKLYAAAGIFLAQLGRDPAALPYLEAAAAGVGLVRPRAYLELARIRLAAALEQPGGAMQKLSAEQHREVLTLLERAYAQSKEQDRYYEAFMTLWENTELKPERTDLESLRELPNIFPQASVAMLRAAQLHARHGFDAEARALCASGLVFASEEDIWSALAELQRILAP